jgi:hypothetical protein
VRLASGQKRWRDSRSSPRRPASCDAANAGTISLVTKPALLGDLVDDLERPRDAVRIVDDDRHDGHVASQL